MARPVQRGKRQKMRHPVRARMEVVLPLSRENYLIIFAGVFVIIIGFIALSLGGVEGFMPLVVAPILLVLGYLVILPVGIMYRRHRKTEPLRAEKLPERPSA
ncbi:MAG: hypothetical protein ACP5JH_03450 [Bacteroidota bacterium]